MIGPYFEGTEWFVCGTNWLFKNDIH